MSRRVLYRHGPLAGQVADLADEVYAESLLATGYAVVPPPAGFGVRYGLVRRLRSLVGPYAGQERDYPEDQADELIANGRAEELIPPPVIEPEPEPEAAAVEAPENAALRRPRRKRTP